MINSVYNKTNFFFFFFFASSFLLLLLLFFFFSSSSSLLLLLFFFSSFLLLFFFFFFFFSLCCRYTPLCVLVFSVIFFHPVLSLLNFLHPLIPVVWISSSTSSIHLFLGLPLILLPIGFHSNILLGILPPSIRVTCPSQAILLLFINLTVSAFPMSSSSSWFFLILQIPFSSCTGPKVSLNIFRSNIRNCCYLDMCSNVLNFRRSDPTESAFTGRYVSVHPRQHKIFFSPLFSSI